MRDFEQRPYSEDEARVAKFLMDKTGIGGGDDPIGSLMASYDYVVAERNSLSAIIKLLGPPPPGII